MTKSVLLMMKAVLLTVCLVAAGSAQAQSLADRARQERQRKQSLESKVSITNDTLKPGAAASIAAPTQPPQTATLPSASKPATASAAATGPTDRQGRDEKYWRTVFSAARHELARAEAEVKVAEGRVTQANRDLLQRSDIFNKEQQVAAQMNTANSDLKTAQQNAQAARDKIAQLEEELRRSGGPAGWAR